MRVRAASVNGFDLAVAAGYTKDFMEHRFPLVLGKDFAGEVDAIGAGVTGYAVGDRVFGTVTKPYLGDGSFAEYVTVPTAVGLAPLPEGVSFTDAAALGLAGTAAHGVIEGAALEPGNTIVVIGATGGVGNQVVQLAAAAGARVIATAHTDAERELVTRLGAHATVDHTGDLSAQIRRSHRTGSTQSPTSPATPVPWRLIRDGGRFVSTLVQSPDQVPTQTASVVPVYANPTREILDELAHAVATGQITVTVQQVFPLQQAPAALAAFGQGTLGKLVITTD